MVSVKLLADALALVNVVDPVELPSSASALLLWVCTPVQVLAWPRASEATTAPVVGLMVSVPSALLTLLTAPLPPA
jgi:hypothetical protein